MASHPSGITKNEKSTIQSATTTAKILMELDQDRSISVGSEICAKLQKELSSSAAGSTSSNITKNDQPSNQSAGTTTTPTENKCDMKTMYKCVVSKLAPYWTTVGDYLEYSVHERNTFKGPDDKKSLVVMLENWIGTDNGRQPKTWSTFIRILMMLDQDLSISVGSEIRARLERELSSSVSSSSAMVPQQPSARSASYSALHHEHDTEGKKLRYEMLEKYLDKSLQHQPQHRQPYELLPHAPHHQPPRFPIHSATGHPVSLMPRLDSMMDSSQRFPTITLSQGFPSINPSQQPQYNIRPFHPKSHHRVQSKPVEHEQMSQQGAQPHHYNIQSFHSLTHRQFRHEQMYPLQQGAQQYQELQSYAEIFKPDNDAQRKPDDDQLKPHDDFNHRTPYDVNEPISHEDYVQFVPHDDDDQPKPLDDFNQHTPYDIESHEDYVQHKPHNDDQHKPHDDDQPKPDDDQPKPHDDDQPKPDDDDQHKHHDDDQSKPDDDQPKPHDDDQPKPDDDDQHKHHDDDQSKPDDDQPKLHNDDQHKLHDDDQPKPDDDDESMVERDEVVEDQIPVADITPFKWKKGKFLGSGAFGRVFSCFDEDNQRTLAVKEIEVDHNWSNDTKKAVESLEKEMSILQKVKHDHLVRYYCTERSETCVCIFMEYMEGGSLYKYIDDKGSLEEHVVSNYTRQLLEGVEYLHTSNIIHKDIKAANILMDGGRLNIKIANFGGTVLLRSISLSVRTQDRKDTSHRSVTGTAYWMAPEVIKGVTIDRKADIWSVGCTVVEMLTCRPPYGHLESFAAMFKIATEPMHYDLPAKCSSHVHDFLSQCFISVASERPTASTLLKHQFVQQIGISNDKDDTIGDGNVNTTTMTSAESLEVMLAKLEQAKAENKTLKVSYTTVLFCGSSGVGKTSLMKKLNKEKLARHHDSTGVAKSKHTICVKTTAVVKSAEGLQWIDLDYDLMISQLNKYLQSYKPSDLENELCSSPISLSSLITASLPDDNVLSTTKNEVATEENKQDKQDVPKASLADVETNIPKANPSDVENDIAKADASNTPSLGEVWNIINFLDTGGQPEFVNILPAVSGSVGLTFIVFDLSKKLDSSVYVQHNVRGNPSFEPYYLDCTNMEFIKRLMISSENFNKKIVPLKFKKNIQGEDQENVSKICYIGTHALNVSEKEIREIDDQLSSIIHELELRQRSSWSSPKESLKRLFPVEMFPDDKIRQPFEDIIENIRDNIQEQVQTQDYYEVPITWFIFLLKLQKIYEMKKFSYISYQEAVNIWMEVNENELGTKSDQDLHEDHHNSINRENSDVHNSLLFFHFMGILLYYHEIEGIRDFVFIDRQWLFEKLTELVKIKFTKCYNKKYINAEDLENFTMQGRLSISIINNLKIDLQGIQPLHFINLLDHLNIVAPFDAKKKDYFMPCVLPSFPLAKSPEKFSELDKCYGNIQHAPLLVGFKNGPIPHGFFCHLIVELFKSMPADWDFPLLPTDSEEMQHVYNNLITFPTATSGHAISLIYKIGYLEIQIRHEENQSMNIHYDVQHDLNKALRNVSDHLQLNKQQLCYGFYCKCKGIQHFAKLKDLTSSTDYMRCRPKLTKLTEDHKVWLQEVRGCHNNFNTVSTGKKPTMRWMRIIVIPKISYCWKTVADYLDYPVEKKKEIEKRQHVDPSECCAELMEDWLTSDRGVKPKTWYMLVSVLKEVGELSAAAKSIEDSLVMEGLM